MKSVGLVQIFCPVKECRDGGAEFISAPLTKTRFCLGDRTSFGVCTYFFATSALPTLPVMWAMLISSMQNRSHVRSIISSCCSFVCSGAYFTASLRTAIRFSTSSSMMRTLPKTTTLRYAVVYFSGMTSSWSMTAKEAFGFRWIASILCPSVALWK